jgi:hypothetical protein
MNKGCVANRFFRKESPGGSFLGDFHGMAAVGPM